MQGFNMGRYYPPTTDNSPPTFNKTHPLGSRARKLGSEGVLTIRFEMPFAVWCSHCPQPTIIPQGVRFNAEKKKVGNYYSTPVWSFQIRHSICGGKLEIQTDPKAAEYVVVNGGKRRDYGDSEVGNGKGKEGMFGEILTEEEKERRRLDAFAALEGRVVDKAKAKAEQDRVLELRRVRERDWDDPYAASQKLRRGFRAERKARARQEKKDEDVKEKFGLGIHLLEESEGDRIRARIIDFGHSGVDGRMERVRAKRLFHEEETEEVKHGKPRTRAERDAEQTRKKLRTQLKDNTRPFFDPFLLENCHSGSQRPTSKLIPGIKPRRTKEPDTSAVNESSTPTPPTLLPLVDYDSD